MANEAPQRNWDEMINFVATQIGRVAGSKDAEGLKAVSAEVVSEVSGEVSSEIAAETAAETAAEVSAEASAETSAPAPAAAQS